MVKARFTVAILIILLMLMTMLIPFCIAVTGWNKTYGGSGNDEARCVIQTSDGGYLLAGYTNSSGAGGYDALIIKTDANGNVQWNKTYGGTKDDRAFRIIETSDGNYAFAGTMGKVESSYFHEEWLVKIDSSGNKLWEQTYMGLSDVVALFQTNDGGYVIGANGGTIKTDSNGGLIKTSDGSITALSPTLDGGYVYLMTSVSEFMKPVLVKIDSSGNTQFSQTYNDGHANSVIQTNDGGYAFAGYGGYSLRNEVGWTMIYWAGKTDSNGNLQWNQTYSGPGKNNANSQAFSIVQTSDGGYAIAGDASPYDNAPNYYSGHPFWLLKLDSNGEMQWNKMYQGQGASVAYSIISTSDGGFALAGFTGNMDLIRGNIVDFWLVKTDQNGDSAGIAGTASPSPSQGTSEAVEVPMWAFNGAHASYETTVQNTPVRVTLTVSNVNVQAQTFDATFTNNASIPGLSFSQEDLTYAQIWPFLAPLSVLDQLNKGQPPSGSGSNIEIKTGVVISLSSGTFKTNEVTITGEGNGIMWIEKYSGVMIKSTSVLQMGSITTSSETQLLETNICPKTRTNTLTFNNGLATFDDLAVTGVKVEISDSKASDGLTANVIVTNFGAKLPSGTATMRVGELSYYDVQVIQTDALSQDAMATISISNSAFNDNDAISYWDGNNWVQCMTSFSTPNTVVVSLPVSALTGTFISVGSKDTGSFNFSLSGFIVALVFIVVVIAIVVSFVLRRRRKSKRIAVNKSAEQ